MLPQDRIEMYGDKPINERAKLFSEMASENYPYQHQLEVGYINGAVEQKMINVKNLKDVLNRLMIDTRDKLEIVKAIDL